METAESVQHDWLTTGTALERQGFSGLAAEVERFRQSLRTPRTRHEGAVAMLVRAHAERAPLQLEIREVDPGRTRRGRGELK